MAQADQSKKSSPWGTLGRGALLSCLESATLGQPFEVWKTRMGRMRTESTMQSFNMIQKEQGVGGFWKGVGPKMFECSTKGAVLLFTAEGIKEGCDSLGLHAGVTGFIAGAGGGVAQTIVMGPSSFLVTAVVTGGPNQTVAGTFSTALKNHGIAGLYPGGMAVAFRQGSNWASRMGFNELMKPVFASYWHGDAKAKLTTSQEVVCGICAGIFSCWNHPFDVARIEGQARAISGEKALPMTGIIRAVHAEYGMAGLFQGIIPRCLFSINQTLFMITGAKILKEFMEKR